MMNINPEYLISYLDIYIGPDGTPYHVICADVTHQSVEEDSVVDEGEEVAVRNLVTGDVSTFDTDVFNTHFTVEENPTFDLFDNDSQIIQEEY